MQDLDLAGAPRDPDPLVGWPAFLSGLLCLAGIGVAAYLTYAHYTSPTVLACSDKGLVDCAKVTTSSYSRIYGIPVSDTGLGYFLAMAVLCSPPAWRSHDRLTRILRLLAGFGGVGMVIWLLYVELFRLNALCLYCTAIHAITVSLFVVVVTGTAATASVVDEDGTGGSVPGTREFRAEADAARR